MTERVEEIKSQEIAAEINRLKAALAQAERERDDAKIEWTHWRAECEMARAEVERLEIENDAARKSIGEAWDTAVADGAKIRSLEAEVERLKADLKVADEYAHQMVSRWNKTEADLARVRAVAERAKNHRSRDCDCAALAQFARAALEGR